MKRFVILTICFVPLVFLSSCDDSDEGSDDSEQYFFLSQTSVGTDWSDPPTIPELRKSLRSPDYEDRKAVTSYLYEVGQSRPLMKKEIDLMLPSARKDPDWRIRVRCIQNLPFAKKTKWVESTLLNALKNRGPNSSGAGNVPLYACRALAQIGDKSALDPMQEWLQYLQSHKQKYPHMHKKLLNGTRRHIAELKSKDGGQQ